MQNWREEIHGKNPIVPSAGLAQQIPGLLEEIQSSLFNKALERTQQGTHVAATYQEFRQILDEKGGFVYAHWDGTAETEAQIKEETKATVRCIPFDNPHDTPGECMVTGETIPPNGLVCTCLLMD